MMEVKYRYDRLSTKCEINSVGRGLVYLAYPPYNKETLYDPDKQEWKRHYYMIMTEPNFQGHIQIMQLTSKNKGELPIALPIKSSFNNKEGWIRCDAIYTVHSSYFKNAYFRGMYAIREGNSTGLPAIGEFTKLCFDFYQVINQLIAADSPEGQQILANVRKYEELYSKLHQHEYAEDDAVVGNTPWASLANREGNGDTLADNESTLSNKSDVIKSTAPIIPECFDDDNKPSPTPAPQTKPVKVEKAPNITTPVVIMPKVESAPRSVQIKSVVHTPTPQNSTKNVLDVKIQDDMFGDVKNAASISHKKKFMNPTFSMRKWSDADLVEYFLLKESRGIEYIKEVTGLESKRIYQLNHSVKNEAVSRGLITRKGGVLDQKTKKVVELKDAVAAVK